MDELQTRAIELAAPIIADKDRVISFYKTMAAQQQNMIRELQAQLSNAQKTMQRYEKSNSHRHRSRNTNKSRLRLVS